MTGLIIAGSILLGLFLVYVLALYLTALYCSRPIRIPGMLTPKALGLPQEKVAPVTSDGITLHGYFIVPPEPKSVAVMGHGYMMNTFESLPLAKKLYEEGVACLIFDFRAHGWSGGNRTTVGWKERFDTTAAFREAEKRFPDLKVWLWGSSMGGAAAVFAVTEEKITPAALILDSSYGSLHAANEGWWRTFLGPRLFWLAMPVWIFSRVLTGVEPKLANVVQALSKVKQPVLFIYGSHDTIVPEKEAKLVIAAVPDSKSAWFDGVRHSEARWRNPDEYDAVVLNFLKENGLV